MQDEKGNESRTVEGVSSVMGVEYDMGWYKEIIHEGAFDEAIKNSDIRALFNHDPNYILARTKSGTLEVSISNKNFNYRFESPQTTYGDDLLVSLERGDIAESSFAFVIHRQRWEEIQEGDDWYYIRHIEEIEIIYDVGPVTYPANPDTSAAKRSFDIFKNHTRASKQIPLSVLERELELL
jgi:HK97 family phage prohead protease